jgi:hypothetical protein
MPSNKGKKALKKGGKGEGGNGPSKKCLRNQEVMDTIGDQENAAIHPQLSWGRVTSVHSIGKKPRVVVDSHAHGRLPGSVLAEKQIASLLGSLANNQPIVLVEYVPSRNSFNILAVVDDEDPDGQSAIKRLNMKLLNLGMLPPRLQTTGEVNLDGVIEFTESSDEEEEKEVDLEDL